MEHILTREIIARSDADTWSAAKEEWKLSHIDFQAGSTCLCTHYPITQLCYLQNTVNGCMVMVGNCCVKKFMPELQSQLVFAGLKRIREDIENSANIAVLELAKDRGIVNEWEYNFYLDTMRKRKLSGKQSDKRVQINQKFLQLISADPCEI